jgi:hypothetical protein
VTAPERLTRRIGRLRPGLIAAPVRAWVVLCWLVSLGLAVVVLIPGLTDTLAAEGSGVIARFSAPLWFRVAILTAASALAGAAVTRAVTAWRMPEQPRGRHAIVRELILIGAPAFPVLALLADRDLPLALLALVLAAGAAIVAHRSAHATLAGLLASLPWLVLIGHQFGTAGSSSASWVWVALFGVAAALAAFWSYYGVARAAESRTARLGFLTRPNRHPFIVAGIVIVAVVIVALRLTVLRELFPMPDPLLWSPLATPPISWLPAAVVAGLLVVVAVRASRRPLRRFGERGVVAVLAALGNLELVISVLVISTGMVVAVATGGVFLPDAWKPLVPAAKFVGVVLLGLAMLLPAFRGTVARWVGLITAIFLAATTAGGAFRSEPLGELAPSPVQVLLLLLVAALALALWNLLRPARAVTTGLVTRLVVVPLVAVHAGWLLPAAWSGAGRFVVVGAVLVALFWLAAPAAADAMRHASNVLSASVAQLLTLLVFVLAIPSLFSDAALVVLGLLWLAIPVMAALTIDTVVQPETQ